MSNLSIQTQTLMSGDIALNIKFSPGETPKSIFLYENNGTEILGRFIGVANVDELVKYKEWKGTPIPSFGNRYVRYNQVQTTLSFTDNGNPIEEMDKFINVLSSRIKNLENVLNRSGIRIVEIDTEKFTNTEINEAQVGTRVYTPATYYNLNPLRISVIELTLNTDMTMNISPGVDGQEIVVRMIQGGSSTAQNPFVANTGPTIQYSDTIPDLSGFVGGPNMINEIKVRYNRVKHRWVVIEKICGI